MPVAPVAVASSAVVTSDSLSLARASKRQALRRSLEEKRAIAMKLAEERAVAARDCWRAALQESESSDEDMGAMERRLLKGGRELQRAELERAMQKKADRVPPRCPKCGSVLHSTQLRELTILSRFGPVTFSRLYGCCPKCDVWLAPADHILGVEGEGKNSPEMSEQMQMLGMVAVPEQAERLSEKLLGFRVDASRIGRELERAGREALDERKREDEQALSTEGRWEVNRKIKKELPQEDFVMVIQADGFKTRERDDWGRSEELRQAGAAPERWHETKAGTIFLLPDRVRCGDKRPRPTILRRSYVSTRQGPFEFSQMLFAQAVRQGLLAAKVVLFIADGGVWLWKIKDDRFPEAMATLDHYHASEHLWTVARARYGDEKEAEKWVRPLIHQLRHGGEAGVLTTLQQMAEVVEQIKPEERDVDEKTILREWEYFNRHRDHIHYESNAAKGYPIGSGCIESTCKQFQLRVKRCGQFWDTPNLEGMLCLYSRYLMSLWN
jgi:hypothetical protein